MGMHHNDMGHVTPDGVVFHQQMDPQIDHEELRRIDDELTDSREYVIEHKVSSFSYVGSPNIRMHAIEIVLCRTNLDKIQ